MKSLLSFPGNEASEKGSCWKNICSKIVADLIQK